MATSIPRSASEYNTAETIWRFPRFDWCRAIRATAVREKNVGLAARIFGKPCLLHRNDTAALARIEVGAHFGKGEMYAIQYSEGRHDMTADEEYVVIPGVRGRVDNAGWWL